MASLPSLFSLSAGVFGFVTLWLSLLAVLSHLASTVSLASLSPDRPVSSTLFWTFSGEFGQSLGLTGAFLVSALACRFVCPCFCDTKEMEFLHKLYFMWLKRCDFSLQVKGHWKHWYLNGLPGGRGM